MANNGRGKNEIKKETVGWVSQPTDSACGVDNKDISGSLKVTIATGVLLAALFVAWQMGVFRKWFLPFVAGAFVACWYPLLDWIAIKKHLPQGLTADTPIIFNAPWYASWTFKLSLTAAVIVASGIWLWIKRKKQ